MEDELINRKQIAAMLHRSLATIIAYEKNKKKYGHYNFPKCVKKACGMNWYIKNEIEQFNTYLLSGGYAWRKANPFRLRNEDEEK